MKKKEKKNKSTWTVHYNPDKDNLPRQIDLTDVSGDLQKININELVLKKIKEVFESILNDIENYVIGNDYSFAYKEFSLRMELELEKLIKSMGDGGVR